MTPESDIRVLMPRERMKATESDSLTAGAGFAVSSSQEYNMHNNMAIITVPSVRDAGLRRLLAVVIVFFILPFGIDSD